ncbi:Nuclear transport (karyopherin beta) [Komagataella phaffii CBS 7435]|uniref:Karyopherin/importin that interacts with the nuclear pore complex n=2 Tax=Komagataella phaffii TaxID=460519 RepID=C4QVM6_KOMPG|nr:Karyopherin/importin that interacts with the nuclear pore complex [Komagataella phaffii GS115]AOA61119.1 GQ67_02500T0 [Komagataella phaffii]CAH2445957.1 Nuclear transport (karyopherin beta) [Komagataella phaffii CBS 7435]AOA66764.1 GQ68_02747T0 [Komagataella phaffii GS115]CAY67299.1 Karyopherin/importin that interacts with the nuclear pore complex [Komagataella phaffii GS115]CCA36404.1 Nuclear transport (karyopherin beta) [Komagataella phaffii CBS 7435]
MSSIPPEINNVLLSIIQALLTGAGDKQIYAQAEHSLNTEWIDKEQVEVLLLFLAEQAVQGQSDDIRAFSCVLFRRFAIKSPTGKGFEKPYYDFTSKQINHISKEVKAQIQKILLQGFVSSSGVPGHIRHKLADCISEVAKDSANEWPTLIPTLVECITNSNDPVTIESAFRVFIDAPKLIGDTYIREMIPVFSKGLNHENNQVKVGASTSFVSVFRVLSRDSRNVASELLPSILNSLPTLLSNGDEESLTSILESLIDLIELSCKIFKPMFTQIIEFVSAVAKDKDLDGSTRIAAMEILPTFAESAPNMCKSNELFTNSVILNTLSMMTEVSIDDEQAAEWANSDDSQEDEDEEEYNAARLVLDRVSLVLGGESLASPLFQFLPQMLQSQQWRERQAALMALSSAAEGCRNVLITEIDKILSLIIPCLKDEHPRVQYACCNALGQISTDFANIIQKTSGAIILPGLIGMLTPQHTFRVQAHAAAAIVNFSECASKEVLEPFLDDLLTNLLNVFSSPKRYVQEQVLTTIAVVADAAEQKFVKYYDTMMPLLFNILTADLASLANTNLRAEAIECATLIASAVGREKFLPHSQELIRILGDIQNNESESDPQVKQYLQQGWFRICKVIGKDFFPCLPGVLPPLILDAKVQQSRLEVDKDEAKELATNQDYDIVQVKGKFIAIHTSLLDDKAAAIETLQDYLQILGTEMYPYLNEIAYEIVIPGLLFFLHDGVRGVCSLIIPSLLQCSIEATGVNSKQTMDLWHACIDQLMLVLSSDRVPELIVAYYNCIAQCLEKLDASCLNEQHLFQLGGVIQENLTNVFESIKAKENKEPNEEGEFYDDEDDYDDLDEISDDELLDEIVKGFSSIFKCFKGRFLPVFNQLLPTVASFINDENSDIRVAGLCMISDVIEHAGADSIQFKEMFLSPVGESLVSEDPQVRQAAAYCVGVSIQYGSALTSYGEYIINLTPTMINIVQDANSRNGDNLNATENVIATLGKFYHQLKASNTTNFNIQGKGLDILLDEWVKSLPIIMDEECAIFCYNFLLKLIEGNDPSVTNNVLHVIDSMIQGLLTTLQGNTKSKVIQAVKSLLNNIPSDQVMALVNKYPQEAQLKLNKMLNA